MLYRKYVNAKRNPIYEVSNVSGQTTKKRFLCQGEEDMRPSWDQVSVFRKTGLFPTDYDSNDFAGFLDNCVLRRSINCIIPRSLKWLVSEYTLREAKS